MGTFDLLLLGQSIILRVVDLIDTITCTWSLEVINETLWPIDRQRIVAIPIGAHVAVDKFVWHYSKDGKFSVSSFYHFIFIFISFVSHLGNLTRNGRENKRQKLQRINPRITYSEIHQKIEKTPKFLLKYQRLPK